MTVGELIAELQKFSPTLVVIVHDAGNPYAEDIYVHETNDPAHKRIVFLEAC